MLLLLITACTTQKYRMFKRNFDPDLNPVSFENHFRGILFFDPVAGDTLYAENSTRYFTPASNVKIFTLYAALRLIPDHMPVLRYATQNDTLFVEGTGDPTQLHPYFRDSSALRFMNGYRAISVYSGNFRDSRYGPGWAWEDYDGYYAPERSGFPLYGNVLRVYNTPTFKVTPDYFSDSVQRIGYTHKRMLNSNRFFFDASRPDTMDIPFITDSARTRLLLSHALGKRVGNAQHMPVTESRVLYGMATDSVCKRMMRESDNFLAEQLLIVASATFSDTLDSERTRAYILEKVLPDLRQPPRWVDGSGLSRYNLFTPESMVAVLNRLYHEVPRERLFSLFAAGGVSGTLKDWYRGRPDPYIYAKTGTLGNNHCVSGYLLTKSGKVVIFSFMNNHFTIPSDEIKSRMQVLFEWVRDHY